MNLEKFFRRLLQVGGIAFGGATVGVALGFVAHYLDQQALAVVAFGLTALSIAIGMLVIAIGWVYALLNMGTVFGGAFKGAKTMHTQPFRLTIKQIVVFAKTGELPNEIDANLRKSRINK